MQVSLVTSKTKVAPIKRLTIPRLELCGAHLLAQLLHHVKEVFHLSLHEVYTWTDSTNVLSWLISSPRRSKTYVGNRVSFIMHGAHCTRPMEPCEWCQEPCRFSHLKQLSLPQTELSDEEREISLHTAVNTRITLTPLDCYPSFTRLKHFTAWMLHFISNCHAQTWGQGRLTSF